MDEFWQLPEEKMEGEEISEGVRQGWVVGNLLRKTSPLTDERVVRILERACAGRERSIQEVLDDGSAARCLDGEEREVRGLVPKLRGYQGAALEWMLERERGPWLAEVGWSRIDVGLWFNPLTGRASEAPLERREVPGGILADEVGLGKTVTVLALVLSAGRREVTVSAAFGVKRSQPEKVASGEMMCLCERAAADGVPCCVCGRPIHPECGSGMECVACEIAGEESRPGGTLIAAPRAILGQWEEEAARHAPSLRVFRYEGVKACCEAKRVPELSPRRLAEFDVVMTSYDVLTKEAARVGRGGGRRKRYARIGSPLGAIEWDRCVLDEAQTCESGTSACARVVLGLRARARWAVTGTPVGRKGLDDLKGLVGFCRGSPWGDDARARDRIWRRATPALLAPVIRRCVWRATKSRVALGLPRVRFEDRVLAFSQVERVFYEDHAAKVTNVVSRALASTTEAPALVDWVGPHLLALRQACCHPSVGSSGAALRKRKRFQGFHTLGEVLGILCVDAKTDHEEAHRLVVLSRCGLAALELAAGDEAEAAETYASALSDVDAHRRPMDVLGDLEASSGAGGSWKVKRGAWTRVEGVSRFEAESTKRLAAAAFRGEAAARLEVLSGGVFEAVAELQPGTVTRVSARARTWRVVVLEEEEEEEGNKAVSEVRFFEAEADTDGLQELHAAHNLNLLRPDPALARRAEKVEALELASYRAEHAASRAALFDDFGPKIDDLEILPAAWNNNAASTLRRDLEGIEAHRIRCLSALEKLSLFPSASEIAANSRCRACRADFGAAGPPCAHCGLERRLIEPYERLLHVFERDVKTDSPPIAALNALAASRKRVGAPARSLERARLLQRELVAMRTLWRRHFDLLSELDTLRQSKTTVQLAEPSHVEALPREARTMYVAARELEARTAEMRAQLEDALARRRAARSKLTHLLTRLDDDDERDDEPTTDALVCAICLVADAIERAVLTECGHTFCGPCARKVGTTQGIRCPTCRAFHPWPSVSFTVAVAAAPSEMVRTYGTKIARIADDLAAAAKDTKCLVFCEWDAVLEILSHALRRIDIPHERPVGSRAWAAKIAEFKKDDHLRALLLNARTASAGLTLVEASRVFLLHPLASVAAENQAVGRVHRIGQTRPCLKK
ncbi:hypothetical protein CTAYLR_009996 [Chrysophaeum taylorii]|uniref:RING-type domain-containing protein n=1 Tax=Chrysophaeum taylorii TaxID=2483200 RepID=A0AAD7U9J7_9STRA|nr:hypothetical protein CTAYLR_009996 [Chrysophaeum taylorii]